MHRQQCRRSDHQVRRRSRRRKQHRVAGGSNTAQLRSGVEHPNANLEERCRDGEQRIAVSSARKTETCISKVGEVDEE